MRSLFLRRVILFVLGALLVMLALTFVYAHLNEVFGDYPVVYFLLGLAVVGGCGVFLLKRAMRNNDYLTRRHERYFLALSTFAAFALSFILLFGVVPSARWGDWGTILFGYVPFGLALLYLVAAAIRFKEAGEYPIDYPELTEKQLRKRAREVRAEWGAALGTIIVASVCLYQVLPDEMPLAEAEEVDGRGDRMARIPEHLRDNWDSLEFLALAADAGNAEAQYRLGIVYSDESHPRFWRNPREAVNNLGLAADQGHVEAMLRLGLLFQEGYGDFHDLTRAARNFERAAEQGSAEGMTKLARLYQNGRGVPQDEPRAYELLREAAAAGHPEGQKQLAEFYQRGVGVERDNERAYHWYSLAARNGHPEAQNDLGLMYLRGITVDQDLEQGVYWLEQAAQADFQVAIFNLGMLYYRGAYFPVDYEASYRYLSRLADAGHVLGHYSLGMLYYDGLGVEPDRRRAFQQYRAAANRGYTPALLKAADMYLEGEGTDRDFERGFAFMEQAATRGASEAQWRMAVIFDEGRFVLRDPLEALKWGLMALNQGYEGDPELIARLESELSPSERRTARNLAGLDDIRN